MTIGGVPPNFQKPWFINPGLTLWQSQQKLLKSEVLLEQ